MQSTASAPACAHALLVVSTPHDPPAQAVEALLRWIEPLPSCTAATALPSDLRSSLVTALLHPQPCAAQQILALRLLKQLTRLPGATDGLASAASVNVLVNNLPFGPDADPADRARHAQHPSRRRDDWIRADLSLRILNNLLLLHGEMGTVLATTHLPRVLDLLPRCNDSLEQQQQQQQQQQQRPDHDDHDREEEEQDPDPPLNQVLDLVFLIGRVLFLCTTPSLGSSANGTTILSSYLSTIQQTLHLLIQSYLSQPTVQPTITALNECLKFLFNFSLYGAPSCTNLVNPACSNAVPAAWTRIGHDLSHLLCQAPTTKLVPPLTGAINVLLNLPLERLLSPAAAATTTTTTTAEACSSTLFAALLTILETSLERYFVPEGYPTPHDPTPVRTIHAHPTHLATDSISEITSTFTPLLTLLHQCLSIPSHLPNDKSPAPLTGALHLQFQSWFLPPSLDRRIHLLDTHDFRAVTVRLLGVPVNDASWGPMILALGGVLVQAWGDAQHLSDALGYGPLVGFFLATGLLGSVVPGKSSASNWVGQSSQVPTASTTTPSSQPTLSTTARMVQSTPNHQGGAIELGSEGCDTEQDRAPKETKGVGTKDGTNKVVEQDGKPTEWDPITGTLRSPTNGRGGVAGTGMDEHQAAIEAHRVMGLLEQLNRTGIMSVDTDAIRSSALSSTEARQSEQERFTLLQDEQDESQALKELQEYKLRRTHQGTGTKSAQE